MRLRQLGLATSVGLALALAIGSSASAYVLMYLSGNYGDFGTQAAHADAAGSPGAVCTYGLRDAGGNAHLTGIKVYGFLASAYSTTGGIDHQSIRFKATLQRSTDGGQTWKNTASESQTRGATDNVSTQFGSLKVKVRGTTSLLSEYRAIVTLDWLVNGRSDGHAQMSMRFYGVKWTVGDPGYVFEDACDGVAN